MKTKQSKNQIRRFGTQRFIERSKEPTLMPFEIMNYFAKNQEIFQNVYVAFPILERDNSYYTCNSDQFKFSIK